MYVLWTIPSLIRFARSQGLNAMFTSSIHVIYYYIDLILSLHVYIYIISALSMLYVKASFSFPKIIPKSTQMYTNLSFYITFALFHYI